MDEKTKQAIHVQQAFIAFVHKESGREVIFIAEPQTGSKTYGADIVSLLFQNYLKLIPFYIAELFEDDDNHGPF